MAGQGLFFGGNLPTYNNSVLAWAAGSDAICHHATLVPPIPPLLRTPAFGHPVHGPADSPPIDEMDKYMPVPEGLSFDHLDTLGRIAPHVYHLPFQDTLIPWSRRWLWGLRSPPAFDDSTDLAEDYVSVRRDGLHGIPPTCSDSSPELIPTADGLCSAFCLDEAAEADVAASKVLLPPHLQVSFCNRLSPTALVPQGPGPPRRQAGTLLRFDAPTRSSCLRRRSGGDLPMHSTTHCAYLGFWRLCSALYDVCHTVSRPLRPGGVPAHSHRGGGTSPIKSLVVTIAAWQTLPGCDALLPKRGDLTVRREAGASAFLHHTGDACSPCSGGSDYSDRQCRSGSPWFSACPAQRPVRLASALPPLYLRRVLRRRQFHRHPRSDDGSMPASSSSYRRRSGVLRTHRLLDEASSQLEPLSGLDLFERIWVLPEGRDVPRLMQAFRERFGIRFGRCLELLQAQADNPADPCCGAPAATDVQGTRSKAAAAPHARARPSGPHRP